MVKVNDINRETTVSDNGFQGADLEVADRTSGTCWCQCGNGVTMPSNAECTCCAEVVNIQQTKFTSALTCAWVHHRKPIFLHRLLGLGGAGRGSNAHAQHSNRKSDETDCIQVRGDLIVCKFQEMEATVKFICLINRLFDAPNSSSPFTKRVQITTIRQTVPTKDPVEAETSTLINKRLFY